MPLVSLAKGPGRPRALACHLLPGSARHNTLPLGQLAEVWLQQDCFLSQVEGCGDEEERHAGSGCPDISVPRGQRGSCLGGRVMPRLEAFPWLGPLSSCPALPGPGMAVHLLTDALGAQAAS